MLSILKSRIDGASILEVVVHLVVELSVALRLRYKIIPSRVHQ